MRTIIHPMTLEESRESRRYHFPNERNKIMEPRRPLFKRVLSVLDAKPGDLFWTSDRGGIVDRIIRIFSTSKVSHVGLVIGAGEHGITTDEAFWDGYKLRVRYFGEDTDDIVRILRPPRQWVHGMIAESKELYGPYDKGAILRLGLERIRRSKLIPLMGLGYSAAVAALPLMLGGWWHSVWPMVLPGVLAVWSWLPRRVWPRESDSKWYCNEGVWRVVTRAAIREAVDNKKVLRYLATPRSKQELLDPGDLYDRLAGQVDEREET